jgi:hypothetical protein
MKWSSDTSVLHRVTKWTQPGGVIYLPPANRELARSYGALVFPQYCAETGWGNWVMGHAWEIVVRLRPTILAAGFAFAILALPSQMLELYLIDMEAVATESAKLRNAAQGQWPPAAAVLTFLNNTYTIWFSMAAGLFTMIVLWLASAHLVCLAPDRQEWSRGRRWLASLLVVLIALTPVLGVLLGLENVRRMLPLIVPARQGVINEADVLLDQVWIYMGVSGALAVVALLAFSFHTFARLDRVAVLGHRVFSPRGVLVCVAILLGFTATIVIWPTGAPWAVGSQPLVYLFVAMLAFLLTWFSQIYRRTGWPITVLVVLAGLLFSSMGWNDNHSVEHKIVAAENVTLEKNFGTWLLSRADRKWYADRGKPYPVYVVATEGGGMFAAYHAASWLGRMQDHCRIFAQHTFAISSVSGGSLGAGVFSAMAHKIARNDEHEPCGGELSTFTKAVDTFFDNDLLAPLVGGTLFPDFLQRLLPFPVKALDRARALEQGFSEAWDYAAPQLGPGGKNAKGLFNQPVGSIWNPKGAAPALFLNTTSVAAGSRVTISPIWFQPTSTALHINSTLCFGGWKPASGQTPARVEMPSKSVELGLAAAISLSARFPWLTPAGWLDLEKSDCPDRAKRDRVYLVDGGYFENSGLETAIEMATYMRAAISNKAYAAGKGVDLDRIRTEYPHGIDIRIIMIFTIDYTDSQYIQSSAERAGSRPGEMLPPIHTMLAGRSARTRAVHLHAVEEGNVPFSSTYGGASGRYVIDPEGDVRFGQDAIHQVWLDGKKFFLPLGWSLSYRSMRTISASTASSLAAQLVEAELEGRDTNEIKGRKPKAKVAEQ